MAAESICKQVLASIWGEYRPVIPLIKFRGLAREGGMMGDGFEWLASSHGVTAVGFRWARVEITTFPLVRFGHGLCPKEDES
ncbi:hypothetical protein E4U25_003382 [Claviceps purpurea]|nr:hypothetical protein E4U25_003382 [Claviceps purpurea]